MHPNKNKYGIGIVMTILFVVVLFFSLRIYLKSHAVYKQSVELIKTNEDIVALLGEPIKTSYFFTGSVRNMSNARYNIRFHGPNGKGSLSVMANKREGEWQIAKALFTAQSKEINLLVENTTHQWLNPDGLAPAD